jgi:uncharacterized metal-binding protein
LSAHFELAPSIENTDRECVQEVTKENTKCFEIMRRQTAAGEYREARVEEAAYFNRFIMFQNLGISIIVFVSTF